MNEFLDLKGDNITIDGKGYTITVTVENYPGFIKNGDEFGEYAIFLASPDALEVMLVTD